MTIYNPCELLDKLLLEPYESTWLEFKRSYATPDEIGEYVSALANGAMLKGRDRAFLVFGVENGTGRKVGTSVRLKKLKKGGEPFESWLSRKIKPSILINCEDFTCEDVDFSIVEIEPSYDYPVRFDEKEYIRIGESKKRLRDYPQLERSLWVETGKRRFESAVAMPNVSDETIFNLLDIDAVYRLQNKPKPRGKTEATRYLVNFGVLSDNLDGYFDITNLGALLLAKEMSEIPSISRKPVRIIRHSGTSKSGVEFEREENRGYAAGFADVIDFISSQLPSHEEFHSGIRHTVHVYPPEAVREILANALIHQDLSNSGAAPMVEIFQNRLEISNPGSSLICEDRMFNERRSRNEKLAGAMRALRLCEERGSGLHKVIAEVEKYGLPPPKFILSEYSMRVVLSGPKLFSDMTRSDRLRACYHHCVVRWMDGEPMSNASLRARFRLDDSKYQTVSAIIRDAIRGGKIAPAELSQANRNARYIPYWAA